MSLEPTGNLRPARGQVDVYYLMEQDLRFKIRFNNQQLDSGLYNQVYLKF